jgi:uncharacterized protein YbaP (TraB family)
MCRQSRLLIVLLLGGLSLVLLPVTASADSWQPTLWKLSSETSSVYLLGSIHVGTPDMYPLPKTIEDAFAASSILLVETYSKGSDPASDATEKLLEERAFYPRNDSLWKHVSKEVRRRLTEFCKKNHLFQKGDMRLKDLARIRPWAVALFVDVAPALTSGMEPDLGVDHHFIEEAEHAGSPKRILPIETGESQARLLSGFPDEVQVKWLESKLGIDADVDAVQRAMVPDRNVHMADVAEQFLKGREQAFMVVGSAHVGGDQGIVHLLELRGYKAEQVAVSK